MTFAIVFIFSILGAGCSESEAKIPLSSGFSYFVKAETFENRIISKDLLWKNGGKDQVVWKRLAPSAEGVFLRTNFAVFIGEMRIVGQQQPTGVRGLIAFSGTQGRFFLQAIDCGVVDTSDKQAISNAVPGRVDSRSESLKIDWIGTSANGKQVFFSSDTNISSIISLIGRAREWKAAEDFYNGKLWVRIKP